jgi:hypothetical protein
LHSSILRKKFFVNFSIFKKIEKFMILYNIYFCKNKNFKIKINFIYSNCNSHNAIFLFYNFSNFNYFSFLWKRKSIDWNLLLISLLFIKNKKQQDFLF